MNDNSGTVYLIPTPIGNLDDISKRTLDILAEVDLVACEDTRHSGRLLAKFGIKKKLISYHNFNEQARSEQLIEQVKQGQSIAVISDGGSPGISDPAYRIVVKAVENDLTIVPLPGPTAIVPALTASGLPTDRFFFEGFLPPKTTARKKRLMSLGEFPHTLVIYESPFRIVKTLLDIQEVLGERRICLAREISKLHEEFIRGRVSEVLEVAQNRKLKGEMVIVIEGKAK